MTSLETPGLSIVIPTYRREEILIQSIRKLLVLPERANQIIIVDQTEAHEDETIKIMSEWHENGFILWHQGMQPSITGAMNHGLQVARSPMVLFLDDDIVPSNSLVKEHYQAHRSNPGIWATVGQVLQPNQTIAPIQPPRNLTGLEKDFDFPFNSTLDASVENVMAGNLCVNRERALSIGGFDENFIGSAYRFETDFARRVIEAGGSIQFIGSAGIEHLRAETGGTRSQGNHLKSASPRHGFGDYYYAFRHGSSAEAWAYSLKRIFREVRTKYHLTHPWWIPVKFLGELRALMMARQKIRSGPKLIRPNSNI